jgi:hypothetical protein
MDCGRIEKTSEQADNQADQTDTKDFAHGAYTPLEHFPVRWKRSSAKLIT